MSGVEQQNIEIKVRLSQPGYRRVLDAVVELVSGPGRRSTDVDTYFRVPHGRLKLRVCGSAHGGTLISYERPNEARSRLSHYRLVPVPEADALRETLADALGVLVTVRKERTVYLYGRTRIHLDRVDDLGFFVELETVLGTERFDDALAEHRFVYDTLGLSAGEIVPQSYSDLLLERHDKRLG